GLLRPESRPPVEAQLTEFREGDRSLRYLWNGRAIEIAWLQGEVVVRIEPLLGVAGGPDSDGFLRTRTGATLNTASFVRETLRALFSNADGLELTNLRETKTAVSGEATAGPGADPWLNALHWTLESEA